jgi:hypothetical protein
MNELKYKNMTEEIIGAAFEVHKCPSGPGGLLDI